MSDAPNDAMNEENLSQEEILAQWAHACALFAIEYYKTKNGVLEDAMEKMFEPIILATIQLKNTLKLSNTEPFRRALKEEVEQNQQGEPKAAEWTDYFMNYVGEHLDAIPLAHYAAELANEILALADVEETEEAEEEGEAELRSKAEAQQDQAIPPRNRFYIIRRPPPPTAEQGGEDRVR